MSDADTEHDSHADPVLDPEPGDAPLRDETVDETPILLDTDDEALLGDHVDDEPSVTRPRRQRPDRGLVVACFVIACGLFGIIWGITSAITGDDGVDRPDAIEELAPVENALQVFQQEQIRVNLQPGYEAYLVVDGIELETTNIGQVEVDPEDGGQQLSIPPTAVFDPGNAIITFRPSDDAVITSFDEGRHSAQVVFWKTADGRETAESYRWSFEVV